HRTLHSFPTRRSSDLEPFWFGGPKKADESYRWDCRDGLRNERSLQSHPAPTPAYDQIRQAYRVFPSRWPGHEDQRTKRCARESRSEEHTSELQSLAYL